MTKSVQIGDIVKIDLGDGNFSYGRVLKQPIVAFYDRQTNTDLSIDEIVSFPVLFKILVMNRATRSGRWEVIGNIALDEELDRPVKFFMQDAISKKFSHYIDDEETPAAYEKCLNLERVAVWDPEHVESRLRDHYRRLPNKWVESLRPVPVEENKC